MKTTLPENLHDLQVRINCSQTLRIIETHARNSQTEEDSAHDVEHLYRVAFWTLKLGEGNLKSQNAITAALLHDLVNFPKNHPNKDRASQYSAEKSREILVDLDFTSEDMAEISDAIVCHSFSRGEDPSTELGKALQDADRLEALGAIGLMRVFSTGTRINAKFFEPNDPWAQNRSLDDTKFSIDHFFTKLLKLPATMKTVKGRKEALRRAKILENFLSDLSHEIQNH